MCNLEQIKGLFLFIKQHDIPNWFALLFTGIAWPLVLFIWNSRKVQNIPNFEISLSENVQIHWREEAASDGGIQRIETEHPAIRFKFSNQTSSTVYLSNARLLKCTKLFNISNDATRDLTGAYELNFPFDTKATILDFNRRETILHSNCKIETGISLNSKPSNEIFSFTPKVWRRLLRYPKFFCLEYVAMVGKKRYLVSTIY